MREPRSTGRSLEVKGSWHPGASSSPSCSSLLQDPSQSQIPVLGEFILCCLLGILHPFCPRISHQWMVQEVTSSLPNHLLFLRVWGPDWASQFLPFTDVNIELREGKGLVQVMWVAYRRAMSRTQASNFSQSLSKMPHYCLLEVLNRNTGGLSASGTWAEYVCVKCRARLPSRSAHIHASPFQAIVPKANSESQILS